MILPSSWAAVLETLRPAFRRRGTFTLFTILATGMVAQTGRRSVVGMLSGVRMTQAVSFHAACRFFSHAVWDIDQLGILTARLIVAWLGRAGPQPATEGHRTDGAVRDAGAVFGHHLVRPAWLSLRRCGPAT